MYINTLPSNQAILHKFAALTASLHLQIQTEKTKKYVASGQIMKRLVEDDIISEFTSLTKVHSFSKPVFNTLTEKCVIITNYVLNFNKTHTYFVFTQSFYT